MKNKNLTATDIQLMSIVNKHEGIKQSDLIEEYMNSIDTDLPSVRKVRIKNIVKKHNHNKHI